MAASTLGVHVYEKYANELLSVQTGNSLRLDLRRGDGGKRQTYCITKKFIISLKSIYGENEWDLHLKQW